MNLSDVTDSILNRIAYLLKIKKPTSEIESHLSDRIEKCLDCPHLNEIIFSRINRSVRFCDKCKCIFPSLAFAYKKRCPDGRWDAIPTELTAASENK